MINTPGGHRSRGDGFRIRAMAVNHGIDLVTAMSGATALIQAIAALRSGSLEPYALQGVISGLAPDPKAEPNPSGGVESAMFEQRLANSHGLLSSIPSRI